MSLYAQAVAAERAAKIARDMMDHEAKIERDRLDHAAGIESLRQQLAKLTMQCEKVVKWKHAMSYNDSYFGEPAGDLKRIVYEIELSMPIRGNK